MLETIAAAGAAAHTDNLQNILAVLSALAGAANAYFVHLVKTEVAKIRGELVDRLHASTLDAHNHFAPKALEERVYRLEQRKC